MAIGMGGCSVNGFETMMSKMCRLTLSKRFRKKTPDTEEYDMT